MGGRGLCHTVLLPGQAGGGEGWGLMSNSTAVDVDEEGGQLS